MALINVLDIRFLNNPAPIDAPYEIEIQFECLEALQNDLEWKLIYVGSGFEHDVELDSLLVGPIPVGINKFVFTADAIDPSQIPAAEVLGVSVILLTASYDDREFVRVGFYSNNEYADAELREKYTRLLAEGSDEEKAGFKFEGVRNVQVQRNILTEKPRVTRFNIKWDNDNFTDAPPVQEEDDEEAGEVIALDQLGEGQDEEEEDDDEAGADTVGATEAAGAGELAPGAAPGDDQNASASADGAAPADSHTVPEDEDLEDEDIEDEEDEDEDDEEDIEDEEEEDDGEGEGEPEPELETQAAEGEAAVEAKSETIDVQDEPMPDKPAEA
ncbi:Histone chaperone asf1 [Savitreella phatthalungensis]